MRPAGPRSITPWRWPASRPGHTSSWRSRSSMVRMWVSKLHCLSVFVACFTAFPCVSPPFLVCFTACFTAFLCIFTVFPCVFHYLPVPKQPSFSKQTRLRPTRSWRPRGQRIWPSWSSTKCTSPRQLGLPFESVPGVAHAANIDFPSVFGSNHLAPTTRFVSFFDIC